MCSLPYLGGSELENKRIFINMDGCFRFIGRTIMTELFAAIGNVFSINYTLPVGTAAEYPVGNHVYGMWKKMFITGTPGFGKTYMLAAFAYRLKYEYYHHLFKYRVVYIPDCTTFAENHIEQMKYALLIAFSSPSEITERRKIYYLKTENAIQDFCDAETNLLFIIDQVNALTENIEVNKFLNLCLSSKIVVKCATVTDRIGQDSISKQRNTKVLKMFGCMDEVC